MIKKLENNEIISSLQLVWEVFMEFEAPDYSEEGIQTFKKFIDDKHSMLSLDFYGNFIDGKIVGIIAMKEQTHITMLFTAKEHHRKGIAKSLFNHVSGMIENEIFTVNSSPYAIGFYHKLGFLDTEIEKNINGIKFTPMQYRK